MNLVDTHCHLNMSPLGDNLTQVLTRARANNVNKIIVPAYDLASWPALAKLSQLPGIFVAFGLHPWVADTPYDMEQLSAALKNSQAVAVGEIGLDSKIKNADLNSQIWLLRQQLDLATELDLPVILHCRGAFEEMLSTLEMYTPKLRGVIHAFSRGPELAKRFVALGLSVAFGGAVTRGNADRIRQACASLPEDRLLLETDAPSIGLHGIPANETEPAHILTIAGAVAQARKVPIAAIAQITTKNAQNLFRL